MRHRRAAVALTAALIAVYALILIARPGGAHITQWLDDVLGVAAAVAAVPPALWRARHSTGRGRLSWGLIGAGAAAWSVGEFLWVLDDLRGLPIPMPSYDDIGYLLFPVLALAGLLTRPSAAFARQGRLRVVLDGALIAASLFLVTWATALGQTVAGGDYTDLGVVVAMAYPITDFMLVTGATVLLAHTRPGERAALGWLASALSLLAVADSVYTYLDATNSYVVGGALDVAWVAGFLLLGLSALLDTSSEDAPVDDVLSPGTIVLPYVPAALGIGGALFDIARDSADLVALVGVGVAVLLLFARQLVVLWDNRALLREALTHQEELRRQAFTDQLTGLANRSLFRGRLAQAIATQHRGDRTVSLLMIDIDDFKQINDTLGHQAGDELLVRLAERMSRTIRSGDTLARLGGDEFAIVIADGGSAAELGERLVGVVSQPLVVSGTQMAVSASIGVATCPADDTVSPTELLRRADVAMYAAKRGGKGRVAAYEGQTLHPAAAG